jgi:hypothetical protein
MEIWKNIPFLNNEYSASNYGRIRRNYGVYFSKLPCGKIRKTELSEKILRCNALSSKGYLRVKIKKRVWFIHTLIGKTWLEQSTDKVQINHKNGVKTDNRPENLEWVTNLENRQHAKKLGLISTRKTGRGLSIEKCRKIINKYKTGKILQKELAKEYGVCQQTISSILRKKESFT